MRVCACERDCARALHDAWQTTDDMRKHTFSRYVQLPVWRASVLNSSCTVPTWHVALYSAILRRYSVVVRCMLQAGWIAMDVAQCAAWLFRLLQAKCRQPLHVGRLPDIQHGPSMLYAACRSSD